MIWLLISCACAFYAGLFPAIESALHAQPQRKRLPRTLTGLLVAQTSFTLLAWVAALRAAQTWDVPWPTLLASLWTFAWIVLWAEGAARRWGLSLDEAALDRRQVLVLPGLGLVSPLTSILSWVIQMGPAQAAQQWSAGRQWGALLATAQQATQGEAPVFAAAQRTLRSEGQGLRPWMRPGLERVPAESRVAAARAVLARSPDTLALLERQDAAPLLLFGTRLVHQAADVPVEKLGVELPMLDPDLDLAEAFQLLRGGGPPFALVGQNGHCEGLLDFEFALSLMLQFEPDPAHVR